MANKIVAVFLMCVVLAAVANVQARVHPVGRELTAVAAEAKFRSCFTNCESECPLGEYNCEMKCDSECSAKEFADKLQIKI
uniref:Uncharacterized protein n=1 Tax=Kalanchoe fedtschenkoi TaxID=63787 RepID=A0A7N0UFX8_KALFE